VPSRTGKLLVFSLVFGLLGLGCGRAPLFRFQSPDALLGQLQKQTNCSRAVSGEAKVFFRGDGRRLAGSVLYLAAAPSNIRFDLISPFGATLATLTADERDFALSDLRERRFYYGPARTCNVQKFTRVPVPPRALVETLRGRPAIIVHDRAATEFNFLTPWLGTPHYRIVLKGEHQTEQILKIGVHPADSARPLAEQRLRYLGSEVWQAKAQSYAVSLSQFHGVSLKPPTEAEDPLDVKLPPSGPACEAELPGRVQFKVPSTRYEVTFDHTEQWHNPPLPPAVFEQEAPPGVQSLLSNCE
jgi:hypothetical protein